MLGSGIMVTCLKRVDWYAVGLLVLGVVVQVVQVVLPIVAGFLLGLVLSRWILSAG